VLFATHIEYPLMMVVALLLRPRSGADSRRARLLDFGVPLVWFAAMVLLARFTEKEVTEDDMALLTTVSLVLALGCMAALARPVRFGLMTAGILAAGWIVPQFRENVVFSDRNFFGILRVVDDEVLNTRVIYHGTTQHGAQLLAPSLRLRPITYYSPDSPVAQVFAETAVRRGDGRIAVVGLGAGTLACLAVKGQHMTFYEIDPAVQRVARDSGLFTFLKDCPARTDIVLGDGRLTIAAAPAHGYDLIVLDAFTSDAVPVHLLTAEAVGLYRSKLASDGAIVFNISNRYLDLAPVLGAVAPHLGMTAFVQDHDVDDGDPNVSASTWVVMAPHGAAEARYAGDRRWTRLVPRPDLRVWTDGYSNLLSAVHW
jgi:hypothetical protein